MISKPDNFFPASISYAIGSPQQEYEFDVNQVTASTDGATDYECPSINLSTYILDPTTGEEDYAFEDSFNFITITSGNRIKTLYFETTDLNDVGQYTIGWKLGMKNYPREIVEIELRIYTNCDSSVLYFATPITD